MHKLKLSTMEALIAWECLDAVLRSGNVKNPDSIESFREWWNGAPPSAFAERGGQPEGVSHD